MLNHVDINLPLFYYFSVYLVPPSYITPLGQQHLPAICWHSLKCLFSDTNVVTSSKELAAVDTS